MKVKYTISFDISEELLKERVSEMNDLLYLGYELIEQDKVQADSSDDFNLELEILKG